MVFDDLDSPHFPAETSALDDVLGLITTGCIVVSIKIIAHGQSGVNAKFSFSFKIRSMIQFDTLMQPSPSNSC